MTVEAEPPRPPWIHDGIDYGPARLAIRELAAWALDIAERDVSDWPVGRGHVRRARRFVNARLAGKSVDCVPVEDVIFTASLLARIFDDDLGLNLSDALTVFDRLDLPTEFIPIPPPRSRPQARQPQPIASPRAAAPRTAEPLAPPPLRFCDECGYVHELGTHVLFRNAA